MSPTKPKAKPSAGSEREPAPRAQKPPAPIVTDLAAVGVLTEMHAHLSRLLPKVEEAIRRRLADRRARRTVKPGTTLAEIWPFGVGRIDRALLEAGKMYRAAQHAAGQSEAGSTSAMLAEISWDVVLGAMTPAQAAAAAMAERSDGRSITETEVRLASLARRSDTSSLLRAWRVYNAVAAGATVSLVPDTRQGRKGALRNRLVAIGARRGDTACAAEMHMRSREMLAPLLQQKTAEIVALEARRSRRRQGPKTD